LALIKTLNEDIEELKVTHSANEKQKKEIQQKNDELNKPLEETKAIIEGLSRDLKNYDKVFTQLQT
jgi:hypothetical protein